MMLFVSRFAYKIWPVRVIQSALLCVSLSACASSPPQMIYVLDATQSESAGTKSVQNLPALEVGPVVLPNYLDTTDIVRRNGAQVVASSTARWGDRLSEGLRRALAAHIATEIPSVLVATNPTAQGPQYRLLIDIQTFEAQSENEVKLVAHWTLLDERTRKPLITNKTVAIEKIQGVGDTGLVDAMNRATVYLSKQIAAQITGLVSRSPKAPL